MPRPGPRPYECVRRAWHSDRHPPIRGSLIQEIFRIANEVHSSTTRKNREWLEKLPTVVLKAEEIMYSKANSEAEYSDRKTLWDRLNDAIDTIIRRDKSTETGEFVQPCIEAALHLGCTPRSSSRSQRNESPRCYLKPQNAGASSVPPSNSPSEVSRNCTNYTPIMLHSPRNLTLYQSIQNRNQNENITPGLSKNFTPDINQPASAQTSSNTWPVYPLYYNNQIQPGDIKSTNLSHSCSHFLEFDKVGSLDAHENITPGLSKNFAPDINQPASAQISSNTWPVYPLYYNNQIQPGDIKSTNLSHSCSHFLEFDKVGSLDAHDLISQPQEVSRDERQLTECDLTLRLGCVAVPCSSDKNARPLVVDNCNLRTFVEERNSRAQHTTDQIPSFPFGRFG